MELKWMNTHLTQAEQLIYNNQVNEGLELLHNLLYEEPGYAHLHNHIGWAYLYYTGEIAQAEMHLKLSIRFNASYAPPYLHMGNLLIRTGRYTEAFTSAGSQQSCLSVFDRAGIRIETGIPESNSFLQRSDGSYYRI